eukprot:scaffold26148_cov23-Tisochrysis_lutea.AAC.1
MSSLVCVPRVYAAEQALLPPHLQARHQLNPSLTACPATAPDEASVGPALGPTAPHTLLLRKPSDIYLMLVQADSGLREQQNMESCCNHCFECKPSEFYLILAQVHMSGKYVKTGKAEVQSLAAKQAVMLLRCNAFGKHV